MSSIGGSVSLCQYMVSRCRNMTSGGGGGSDRNQALHTIFVYKGSSRIRQNKHHFTPLLRVPNIKKIVQFVPLPPSSPLYIECTPPGYFLYG